MYDNSSHYFRLFKSSNSHIRLFDSIDIQNTLKKVTFRRNLNHEFDDSDRENRFIFDISIEQQTTSFSTKRNRQFRHANSNRKIIIHKFEIIDNVITLQMIDVFIDFFREYNIAESADLKIKIDQNIEDIFNIMKQIWTLHINLEHRYRKTWENWKRFEFEVNQLKTQTRIKENKITDLRFEIVIMFKLRSRVNSLQTDFTRVRENRNEYRKRTKIYKAQMTDLKIDKKNLKKNTKTFS